MALATIVVEKIIKEESNFRSFFNGGLTMEVPPCNEHINPHYHSIVGQKLLLVDWHRFGIKVPCPDATYGGMLENDPTNFSKNKTLFPIFGLSGAPSWAIVQKMACGCCRRSFFANESEVLLSIPAYAASNYPVETKYAMSNKSSHIARTATDVFDTIMMTYGNGELCSRLLYDSINRAYIERLTVYLSYLKEKNLSNGAKDYIPKDGTYIKLYPPLGDTIRDLYNEASSSAKNPWGISDHDRHTREIQSVKVSGIFAQDHTFEVLKNYQKNIGAKAVWDVATETGEIAVAVLVPSTKTRHFVHAAKQLTKRPTFKASAMYSDTWPNKKEFWESLVPGIKGRLGLFHFEKRIIGTIRKSHVDCFDAITDLLDALYEYCSEDLEKLLSALRNGTMSLTGKCYSTREIAELRETKQFRDRYGKYLRKKLREPHTMEQRLDNWFCKYKVTSSDPNGRPARGRLDPEKGVPLFTPETKDAVENCKQKAKYLADPLPLEKMYDKILPNPNASHQLTEYLSKRGESKLEAFHDRFAHFANSGMRSSLANNLNLCGTARYNLKIRHKRSLMTPENPYIRNHANRIEERKKIPAAWEKVVPYYNHTELDFVNNLAQSIGLSKPFPNAEILPEDNGERFFSEYMMTYKPQSSHHKFGEWEQCLCKNCETTDSAAGAKQQSDSDTATTSPLTVTTTTISQATTAATSPTNITTTAITQNTTNVNNNAMPPQARMPATPSVPAANSNTTIAPQHHFTNSTSVAPSLLQIAPHATQQWAVTMPHIQTLPLYYVAPTWCCHKYRIWTHRRIGRPPHDSHCRHRQYQWGLSGAI